MKGKEFTEGIAALENFLSAAEALLKSPERIAGMKKRAVDNPSLLLGTPIDQYFALPIEKFSSPES